MPDSESDAIAQLTGAFKKDDAALFRQLLERWPHLKPRLNEPLGPFDSPLIACVRSRDMLDVLLAAGANINEKSRWWAGGFGLLHGAEPALAAYAIERGAQVDVHAAARLGLVPKLQELLAADPSLVNAPGGDGQTPLHFASTVPIAELLLEKGAKLDARDVDHESTPAQYMVRERQDVARYLVRRGCQTDILMAAALGDLPLVRQHLADNPDGVRMRVTHEYFPMSNHRAGGTIYQWTLGWFVSPHDVARQFGHADILRVLQEHSPPEVRLLDAGWTADEAAVATVLREHPGLAAQLSESVRRYVAHAARNNQAASVRVMLNAGWPVDALSQHRATPLHWAAFHGNAEMARDILQHHPPLEVTDADFKATPLGWAIHGSENGWYCRTGDYAGTVETLLQAGATLGDKPIAGSEPVQAVLRRYGK
jgi:hypothetical protein